jgi:hypothetical protein
MRPVEGQPFHPRQLLRDDILRLTYLERQRATQAALSLFISERPYYRELQAAPIILFLTPNVILLLTFLH